jgi:nitrogen fixation NifU-like protein
LSLSGLSNPPRTRNLARLKPVLLGPRINQRVDSQETREHRPHIEVCRAPRHTPAMYSEAVLDHFQNPRNAGTLDAATATVSVENPVCGDILELSARVEAGRIAEARFRTRGCVTALACSSLLTELLRGKTPSEASAISSEQISQALGGLPPATLHGAQLARDAVQALLAKLN